MPCIWTFLSSLGNRMASEAGKAREGIRSLKNVEPNSGWTIY